MKNFNKILLGIYFTSTLYLTTIAKESSSLFGDKILSDKNNSNNELTQPRIFKDFIPKGYAILDSTSGYINNDKLIDKIIVLSDSKEHENNNPRLFMILLYQDFDRYTLKLQSPNVIPCLRCASGTGGEDSYSDLKYKKNILSFNQITLNGDFVIEIKYEFLNKLSEFKLNNIKITKFALQSDAEYKTKVVNPKSVFLKDFDYRQYQKYLTFVKI